MSGPRTLSDGELLTENLLQEKLPVVSIIIPMLNERDTIVRCVNSILSQDYPGDKLEIVIVDGLSTDGSREQVQTLVQQHVNIRLLDNPQKRTPRSLNTGIKNARGDVVIILGAHTTIDRKFVSTNIKYMNELDVKCTGGTQINVGDTYLQRAIGCGMGSVFGMPSAPYRFFPKKRFVDTVVYAAYRKELFEQIGYFDEELHISEDAELNWRIRQAGYKIFYTPEIVSYYYPRKNLKTLFKQFFNYGILRVNVIKKHADALKLVHLLPPLFVGVTILFGIGGFIMPRLWYAFLIGLVLYVFYTGFGAVVTAARSKKFAFIFVLPLVFATMQISWGLGFIVGIFKTTH